MRSQPRAGEHDTNAINTNRREPTSTTPTPSTRTGEHDTNAINTNRRARHQRHQHEPTTPTVTVSNEK